ncbi:MAG: tRNA (guanosine(37)-N1)-methyltransferase TrmD [Deltaproteobacteria bacterium]|nr:tRNA (guanosine(37)-N1)-methyltransferase TrmD [Deltaproteobacteria bacterium]MBI4794253.1 tRNA (guanosine(37)-N1)-methyltransferase TrmD [Deltaproteobacteria bacterium]
MLIELLTLFPEFFNSPLSQSMLQRAQSQGAVEFRVLNLRDFTFDRHRVVDDRPFGGGPGMVLKIEPLVQAIRAVREQDPEVRVILLSPQGFLFSQDKARELAGQKHLLLICGHYEGVDERIHFYIDEELSIGDYILTGGEIPALVVVDAVTRLLPGVLGGEGAVEEESFQTGLLEYPHYTRPRDFEGHEAPEILLSGDHQRVARWRRQEALRRTAKARPDLLEKAVLEDADREFLATSTDSDKKD